MIISTDPEFWFFVCIVYSAYAFGFLSHLVICKMREELRR